MEYHNLKQARAGLITTKTQMIEPWGESLYRAAAFIAAIVAMLAIFNFIYNLSHGEPIVSLPALAFCRDCVAHRTWLPLRVGGSVKVGAALGTT